MFICNQQSLPSNNTNQAFGNHIEQRTPQTNNNGFGNENRIISNGQNRPQLPPQTEIQSQVQRLKKPSQTIQRQTSLPTMFLYMMFVMARTLVHLKMFTLFISITNLVFN